MRYILITLMAFLTVMEVDAQQQTTRIRQLEIQRNELKKQISESEQLLLSTKNDVKSQLSNLALLSGQIDERQKYIWKIENDVRTIQLDINRMTIELKQLEKDLKDRQDKYVQSVRYMRKRMSIQEKLVFIFSAEDLGQIYRRLRYVREYADFQKMQGEQVKMKAQKVKEHREQLMANQREKKRLLLLGESEKLALKNKEKERRDVLASLQKQQRDIQNEISKKRRSANELNAQIDKLIEAEIEMAKKRAEAARKKKPVSKSDEKTTVSTGKVDIYRTDADDRKLSGSFEKNKGSLPVPITGPYVLVGHYGQYQVKGLKNVKLDNKGVDIKGKQGAYARAIFDGEVSAVFQHNGLTNVLVRHGSYISVYCNLASVRVKRGSLVKTRDALGEVHTDGEGNTVLHFQLRKETVKLNPELWIKK